MVLRFSGFELDRPRAELRGLDGEVIKLRPKTFAMLSLFAANAGRVLSKQELMDAVWPNVHVGDDSLFQCIKEIRTALGRLPVGLQTTNHKLQTRRARTPNHPKYRICPIPREHRALIRRMRRDLTRDSIIGRALV